MAEDLKVTDREAVASVKSTCDNYLGRLLQDPDVKEKVEQVEEQYGDEIEEWQLENKGGWDGSTQKRYNVSIFFKLNEASLYFISSNCHYFNIFPYSFSTCSTFSLTSGSCNNLPR